MASKLLAYGAVAALLGGVALWALAPDPWPLQGSRTTDLNAALAGLEAGEPPLVGLRPSPTGGEERYAAGASDDQGLYVYAPLASRLFGLNALDGLKLLWAVLFAFAIGVAPWLYYRLFGSLAVAVIAPLAVFAAVATLRMDDIYWVPAWAAIALLPPVILLDRLRPRAWLPVLLILAVLASFASSIRSNAGLPVALVALFIVLTAGLEWWKRGLGAVAVVTAYLSISSFGLALVRDYRDHQVGSDLGKGQPTAHPFWHAAYLGLGYLPNDQGIYYRDDIAFAAAQREDPGVRYLSTEYEQTLRKLTLDYMSDEPLVVAGHTAQKLIVVVKDSAKYLLPVVLLLPAFVLVGAGLRERRRITLMVLPAVLISLTAPLLAIPYEPFHLAYGVGLFGSLNLLALMAFLWIVSSFGDERTLGGRRWMLRGSPKLHRAMLWSLAGIVVVVACVLVGESIEDRATRWQNSAPPLPAPVAEPAR